MANTTAGNREISKESLILLRKTYSTLSKDGVSVVVPTFKSRYASNIFKNYLRSTYPIKELIIILNNDRLNVDRYNSLTSGMTDVKVLRMDRKYTLGECLNLGIENSKYPYIARMDDDDYYAPDYLADLMNVFNYTDAQITGKNPVFVYFESNCSLYLLHHTNPIMGATFLFNKDIFNTVRFRNLNFKEDYYFLSDCINSGIKIHPSDKYNFVYRRHRELNEHTFRIPAENFISAYDLQKIITVKDFRPLVTV